MTIEGRATIKRMATMLCSIGTIVCYGYLIGGVGGYLFGKGRPLVATVGFASGTALAALAIFIWKSYLSDLALLEKEEE